MKQNGIPDATTDSGENLLRDRDLKFVVGGASLGVGGASLGVGGASFAAKPATSQDAFRYVGAFDSLKVDPRLGDWIVNGACDCCKWEPAIV